MASDIRKSTTALNVDAKYSEIKDAARKMQQLAKEVRVQCEPSF